MMIQEVIHRIKSELIKTFDEIGVWFNADNNLLDYKLENGGWTVRQILEHISLTNHYLLILIRKGTNKAITKARNTDYTDLLNEYDLDWDKLILIGEHKSFDWNRPEHMEPTGEMTMGDVKTKLNGQLQECLGYLQLIPNGEGVFYKTMMTVNNLGKIDVYHYIYFLVQHAKRHITQMEKIKTEMERKTIKCKR